MPKLQGFSIDEFIHYQPAPNTVAISFNSELDQQFNPDLYDQLNAKYQAYDDTLVIRADDVTKPVDDCQVFTKADAQAIKDFVKQYPEHNIIVHCNAGVSRTGSVIHYIQEEYPYFQLVGQQDFSFNPLISYLLDVRRDNPQRLFKENQAMLEDFISQKLFNQ